MPVPRAALQWALSGLYFRQVMRGMGDPELARHYASHYNRGRDIVRMLGLLLAMDLEIGPEPIRAGHVRELSLVPLDPIRVPVLVVWGAEDDIVDLAGAEPLLAAVPDSHLVVLEGCGHLPHVEQPAVVAELVTNLPEPAWPRVVESS
jgi:pimeloyl-ACP methyl ester carboxylesterase